MTIHGIQSGPLFISQHPQLAYGIFAAYILAHPLMVLIIGVGALFVLRIDERAQAVLAPVVLVLCVIGAYALNNTMANVYVLLLFGVLRLRAGEGRLPARAVDPGRDPRRPDRDQPGPRHHDRLQSLAVPHAADLGRRCCSRPCCRSPLRSGSICATRSAPTGRRSRTSKRSAHGPCAADGSVCREGR